MSGMMSAMVGGGGVDVNLTARSVSDNSAGVSTSVSMFLNNTGVLQFTRTVGADVLPAQEWTRVPITAAQAAMFEAVVSVTSGTLSSGTAGTFNLGTTRNWGVAAGSGATKTATISVTIQYAGGGAIQAGPVSITMSANSV
jgi:hypothetical protein